MVQSHLYYPCSAVVVPREAWIETLDTSAASPLTGLIHLHPKIFGAYPRMDLIHENVVWQQKYRRVVSCWTFSTY